MSETKEKRIQVLWETLRNRKSVAMEVYGEGANLAQIGYVSNVIKKYEWRKQEEKERLERRKRNFPNIKFGD